MTVALKPETERLVQEEIRGSVTPPRPRKELYDLLTQLPFGGSKLHVERRKDYPRPVDL